MSQSEPAAESARVLNAMTIVLGLFGLGNLANGIWMLAAPVHWYYTLPAAVPDFGPLNEHFIRDIGCIFTLLGVALVGAAFRPSWRIAATATAAGFSLLHALVHVVDTVRGLVGPEHWMIDAPGVYAPAVVLTALALWIRRSYA